ncbi:MAG: cation transporting ATPase C-terminal domain-containing protein, partial [Planctomycetes bacterium]|nr:cation transporting ATPase C-terminal domain-containing protein [Planctomycetota bacterium]
VGVFTNKKLLLATGLSLAMQITIVYIPYLEDVFKVTPLDIRDWMTVFGFSSLIFIVVEAVKHLNSYYFYNLFRKERIR